MVNISLLNNNQTKPYDLITLFQYQGVKYLICYGETIPVESYNFQETFYNLRDESKNFITENLSKINSDISEEEFQKLFLLSDMTKIVSSVTPEQLAQQNAIREYSNVSALLKGDAETVVSNIETYVAAARKIQMYEIPYEFEWLGTKIDFTLEQQKRLIEVCPNMYVLINNPDESIKEIIKAKIRAELEEFKTDNSTQYRHLLHSVRNTGLDGITTEVMNEPQYRLENMLLHRSWGFGEVEKVKIFESLTDEEKLILSQRNPNTFLAHCFEEVPFETLLVMAKYERRNGRYGRQPLCVNNVNLTREQLLELSLYNPASFQAVDKRTIEELDVILETYIKKNMFSSCLEEIAHMLTYTEWKHVLTKYKKQFKGMYFYHETHNREIQKLFIEANPRTISRIVPARNEMVQFAYEVDPQSIYDVRFVNDLVLKLREVTPEVKRKENRRKPVFDADTVFQEEAKKEVPF